LVIGAAKFTARRVGWTFPWVPSGQSDHLQLNAMDDERGSGAAAAFYWPEISPEDNELDNETLVISERRARIASQYCARKSMRDISRDERCSLGTVYNDLHAVFEGWKRLAAKSYGDHVADALLRLAHREADIEGEWEKSKGEAVESYTSRRKRARRQLDKEKDSDETDEARVKKKQQYGDPRLAAILMQIWDRRCRILGLLKAEDFRSMNALPPVKVVAGLDPAEVV
jgi:hypothetical protein